MVVVVVVMVMVFVMVVVTVTVEVVGELVIAVMVIKDVYVLAQLGLATSWSVR